MSDRYGTGVRIRTSRTIRAKASEVWARLVDWEAQGQWMPGTTVRVLPGPRHGRGTRLEAVTGLGPFRVVDPMEVVVWEPPTRCVIRHDGAVLRGTGTFTIEPLGPDRCRLTWQEELTALGRLPAVVGRVAARAATPFFTLALRRLSGSAQEGPGAENRVPLRRCRRTVVFVDGLGVSYADHLTTTDLELLARTSGGRVAVDDLRRDPTAIPRLLSDPAVFEAVFGTRVTASGQLLDVSPFLVFALVVHRSADELSSMNYVLERTAPRQTVPVFDAPQLVDFLSSPARRFLLAELLASFTRVASGRYRVRTGRGWRWRRFSELDPVRLAGLLEAVSDAERPGIYRRLGDVALFLSGVFPEYVQQHALGPIDASRLLRLSGVGSGEERERMVTMPAVELFEHLGARWYRRAYELAPFRTVHLDVVADVADRFRQARRVLNHITDRYLFPILKEPGGPAGSPR